MIKVHTSRSRAISIPSHLNIVFISNFDLHIFRFNIDLEGIGSILHLKNASSLARNRFAYRWLDNVKINTCKYLQNLVQIYHVVQEL